MIAFAPCKINIGLNIQDKRPDGFHNLESYFYPVPLYDIIEIHRAKEDKLIQTGIISTKEPQHNLVCKALKLIRKEHPIPPLKIHLHKQIPVEAGLGGGSSDAAHIIKLIYSYFKIKNTNQELHKIALQIGSDCPFFLDSKPSKVMGRGEKVVPLNFSLKSKYIIIVKPPYSVSTKEAFSKVKNTHFNKLDDIRGVPYQNWQKLFTNDFEKQLTDTPYIFSEIKNILTKASAFYVSLSGSGSALFGLFHKDVDIEFPPSYFVWKSQLQ